VPQIIDRFLGSGGRANRVEALLGQPVVGGNRDLANELADRVELLAVEGGQKLIDQGAEDDDLFFILAGTVSVFVNGRKVAARGRGEHVGEMAVIEPTQRRSATVVADDVGIVARIGSGDFADLGSRYPEMYRHIAKVLSRRLSERNRLVGQYREKIRVFIISSAEALPIARIIQNSFEYDPFLPILWTDGVFRVANYTLNDLEAQIDQCDFAVAIAHSDDWTDFRGQEWPSPRDNVIFELGLFMGRLGRARAILMEPREDRVKLPSDLSGVTTIPYRYEKGKDAVSLMAAACDRLRNHINELGPFNG